MTEPTIGRNEPCPCGSGKKYKRCCGMNAAPKLSLPTTPPVAPGGMDPSKLMEGMDQQMMLQFAQSLQRLPKGQLQRLQNLMQKGMAGKDITREAAEFEASLPVEFQQMLKNFKLPPGLAQMGEAAAAAPAEPAPADMTADQAREIVEKAAAEGKISKEQADELLQAAAQVSAAAPGTPADAATGPSTEEKGFSKLWKKMTGGK